MNEHKPMSEVLADLTGQVCVRCQKNYVPRKRSLCDGCAAIPQPKQEPQHPYWCDCEICLDATAQPAGDAAKEQK